MPEKEMPDHKPMKDRLTLALCTNVSGNSKITPLLVYHWENPRVRQDTERKTAGYVKGKPDDVGLFGASEFGLWS